MDWHFKITVKLWQTINFYEVYQLWVGNNNYQILLSFFVAPVIKELKWVLVHTKVVFFARNRIVDVSYNKFVRMVSVKAKLTVTITFIYNIIGCDQISPVQLKRSIFIMPQISKILIICIIFNDLFSRAFYRNL